MNLLCDYQTLYQHYECVETRHGALVVVGGHAKGPGVGRKWRKTDKTRRAIKEHRVQR